MRLVLWDIDGTLVHTAGHGREAFLEAFANLIGRAPDDDVVPMAGRTDHAIALDLLERNGVPDPEDLLPRMFEQLHVALERRLPLIVEQGHPQPGAREALAAIREAGRMLQSPLTGNIEPNARIKLGAFGLDALLELEIGGYGSEHGTRSELVGIARRKTMAKHGLDVLPAETVLIGDTPLDVDAARAAGARVIAVATGPYGVDELEQARPDAALTDLRQIEALLEAIERR